MATAARLNISARVALQYAEKLLDSVAFVSTPGDADKTLTLIRSALAIDDAVIALHAKNRATLRTIRQS